MTRRGLGLAGILILLGSGLGGHCQSPASHVELAARDLAGVRPDRRPFVRYLSAYHQINPKNLASLDQILRFWVNSLSRDPELIAPTRVAPGLWRVDLEDYQWSVSTWEKLAQEEPYFTLKLVVARQAVKVRKWWPGGKDKTGKYFPPHWYEVEENNEGEEFAAAPWTPAREALYLREQTGSVVPVVRADWWIWQTATQVDRKVGYYDFLGLGTKEADFHELVGADIGKARKLRREIGALVSRSTVTLHNRALERFDAISGPYWRSRDFNRDSAEKNALRILDGDIEEDASEQYGSLPNRLWAFWLQDGQGNRQDTAPDFIASDGLAHGTDRRVVIGLSCVRCHVEGIRPIKDWARKVYQPPFDLEDTIDYRRTRALRSKYLSDLAEAVLEDQERYARVLLKVNGLAPADNARLLGQTYAFYEEDRSLATFSIDLGVTEKQLTDALRLEAARLTRTGGKLDPLLAGLLQGLELRIEHAHELVPLAHEILSVNGS